MILYRFHIIITIQKMPNAIRTLSVTRATFHIFDILSYENELQISPH